jgi:hypothetical protein
VLTGAAKRKIFGKEGGVRRWRKNQKPQVQNRHPAVARKGSVNSQVGRS